MFGYMYPFKPDLKIKHYTTFKSYYCSLCHEIKKNYGNIPRVSINFDITFISILLDSFSSKPHTVIKKTCIIHPIEKKLIVQNNKSINYASHINTILTHNKILDDINDENNLFSKLIFPVANCYVKKMPKQFDEIKKIIDENLHNLKKLENSDEILSIDEYAHPFSNLTKEILNFYGKINNFDETSLHHLGILGYNLGKWIYIVDAFDDIEKDFRKNLFNPIIRSESKISLNENNILQFKRDIKQKYFSLLTYVNFKCLENFKELSVTKNYELIENILQMGMPLKVDKIVNHFECSNKKGSVKKDEQKIL